MMSISRWGMFEALPRLLIVPTGWKITDQDRAEWLRLDGWIEITRNAEIVLN